MSVGLPSIQENLSASNEFSQEQTLEFVHEVLNSVEALISPVWPLKDYVAVNPYGGMSDQSFLATRTQLQEVSECEMLMPFSYYQQRWQKGKFGLEEIETAIDEMVEDQVAGAESLCANAIFKRLSENQPVSFSTEASNTPRLETVSSLHDRMHGSHWTELIHDEVSKLCASHYDEGQAQWSSPCKHLPLYQAWRVTAVKDRRLELLGLQGIRTWISNLPISPELAILSLLEKADIPAEMWSKYLHCLALDLPGWSSWTKYKATEAHKQGKLRPDFVGLLAIRLAYDLALSELLNFQADLETLGTWESTPGNTPWSEEALTGLALLRANEIGFRSQVLHGMHGNITFENNFRAESAKKFFRPLAQMVFCIDVRSERIRRCLEASSDQIETFGFAGFFGLPFDVVRLGENQSTNQLPVLLDPQFTVYEDLRACNEKSVAEAEQQRNHLRSLRQIWKRFQTSSVSCFAFVESTGLLYAYKLLRRITGTTENESRFDGIDSKKHDHLSPSFKNLEEQGITAEKQVDMAQAVLTNLGLKEKFGRLVVLCGHGSQTENNPLQAGLDCGACGGHSGEVNARFTAMLLNLPHVRDSLGERGIRIPVDTQFVAGLHNTTTDEIQFFDLDLLPESHRFDLQELTDYTVTASRLTRSERLQVLPGKDEASLLQRSVDWSEVRPEWGLTGNAAFIVGPRSLTKSLNLRGETFLHSYDYRQDTEGKVLELIMTAPMVVANWINMQYYASTVDQRHFGCGNKMTHNVVGKFGLFAGNGGDLQTGLPWESIHDGEQYQHDPVRLLSVIEAPRSMVEEILQNHPHVHDLVRNGWVQLVVVDEERFYRYSANSSWTEIPVGLNNKVSSNSASQMTETVEI